MVVLKFIDNYVGAFLRFVASVRLFGIEPLMLLGGLAVVTFGEFEFVDTLTSRWFNLEESQQVVILTVDLLIPSEYFYRRC